MFGGAHRMFGHRLYLGLVTCLALLISTCFSHALPAKAAYGPLELVRDYVATTAAGELDIQHTLNFTLPLTAQQITPSDWVLINMPGFYNVEAPSAVIGGSGTPVVDVVGKIIRITGIALLPGADLEVRGFIADNPPSSGSQQIIISIAEDGSGTVIRNQAITVPVSTGGYVSVSATIETPLSSIRLSGYTAPSAFVTMTENSAVIATISADGTGAFTFLITGLPPGAHTFSIFSTDTQQRTTSVSTQNVFLTEGTQYNLTGVLLSPTLSLSATEIDPGNALTISGEAKPNSQVTIYLEAPLRSYTVTSNGSGVWTYTVLSAETLTFTPGQYQVYAIVQDALNNLSLTSPTASFRVRTPDSGNPPPACDISRGDLNCNGVTNLVDFSILLFHWQTNHRVADINSDTRVNLTDFSIMMFYFTR